MFDAVLDYKLKWDEELERRKRLGITGPAPLPHPDDLGSGKILVSAAWIEKIVSSVGSEAVMEWVLKLEATNGWGEMETIEVGRFERRVDEGIRAFALHPGGIAGTNLGTHVGLEMLKKTGFVDENDRPVVDLSRDLKSVPQGAATHVCCGVRPQLDGKGGVYCADSDITPVLPEGGSLDLNEDRANRSTGVGSVANLAGGGIPGIWAPVG